MSTITAPAKILVTGGTGFVGASVIANLLSKGFSILAVVRSTAKAAPLQTTFKSHVSTGHLTFAIVPDMTVPGAIDMAGVDGIIHSASPLPPMDPQTDPEAVIGPAVQMTTSVLREAARWPSVKRVVITSSIVTIWEPKQGSYIYSELDWFNTAPKLVEEQGVKAPSGMKYTASKVLAERAAWEWVENHKPSFELVTVLPPWIWGRSATGDIEHFRAQASNNRLLSAIARVQSGSMDPAEYLTAGEYADVLDVAEGHVKALVVPAAAGERFALRAGQVTWQDVADIIGSKSDGATMKGQPGSGKDVVMERPFSGEKAIKILGMKYRSLEDTVDDVLSQAIELGVEQQRE